MLHSDAHARTSEKVRDWRSWVLLAWAIGFGLLYGRMVLERRAPDALSRLRHTYRLAVAKLGGNPPSDGPCKTSRRP